MESFKPVDADQTQTIRVYFDHDTNGPSLSQRVNEKITEIVGAKGYISEVRYSVADAGIGKSTHNVAVVYCV